MEDRTTKIDAGRKGEACLAPDHVIDSVYRALTEKGYDPVYQLVGYLLSGDPAYITSHGGARGLIGRVDRDQLIAEVVGKYLQGLDWKELDS